MLSAPEMANKCTKWELVLNTTMEKKGYIVVMIVPRGSPHAHDCVGERLLNLGGM